MAKLNNDEKIQTLLNALTAIIVDLEHNGEIFNNDQTRIDFMQASINTVKGD